MARTLNNLVDDIGIETATTVRALAEALPCSEREAVYAIAAREINKAKGYKKAWQTWSGRSVRSALINGTHNR